MVAVSPKKLSGIAPILVQEALLDADKALDYQKSAKEDKVPLLKYLVDKNILSSTTIACSVAKSFGAPIFDIESIDPEMLPLDLVSDKLIRRHHLLPLFNRGRQLYVALDDPSNQSSLKEIQFHTGLHAVPLVVETDKLNDMIDTLLNEQESQGLASYFDETQDLEGLEISTEEDEEDGDLVGLSSEDAPIVKFVNRILVEAIRKGASDIHFEPYEGSYRIRYRLDGILNEVTAPPYSLSARISARIKVMSNLDISERRIPQDGRFKMKISSKRSIDFRVSTCPTVAGEKLVMRILDPGSAKIGIEALGFDELQKSHFQKSIGLSQGMILVTGPTGSGKTVTLYTGLNMLNQPDRNISTAEDPVEIKMPGVNQVNIHPKAGLTFSSALRSFLRQDPDIIMIGEIRDLETAEIAIKAAQTGHLVLSTLHTNSAAETLTRMVNMGIPSYNIASSVSLIIAQRLIRRLCEQCKEIRNDITEKSLIELGFSKSDTKKFNLYKAVGCSNCTDGYKGRVGLFEVMPMTKELGRLIMSGGNPLDILTLAQEQGMLTIHQSGLGRIMDGITTIEEVNRVTID